MLAASMSFGADNCVAESNSIVFLRYRLHVCSMLAEDAIKAAVKDYQAKRAAGKAPTVAAAEVKAEQEEQAQTMTA